MSRLHAPLVFSLATLVSAWGVALSTSGQASEPRPIRILSYNIHHGEGVDGQVDLARIAEIICETKADLVALQEVDRNTNRTGHVDQARRLAELTKMHFAFGDNILLQGGEYGNAILSRWPIIAPQNHLLPCFDDGEQRGVLDAIIDTRHGRIRFLATHLDHRPDPAERLASVDFLSLLAEYSPEAMRNPDRLHLPTLLAGDLNAGWDSQVMRNASRHWTIPQESPLPTTPVSAPQNQIDFILFRPSDGWAATSVEVLPEKLASDHRPILATLELLAPPFPGKQSEWHGFRRHEFEHQGLQITVVAPKEAAAGRPWVWHGEFFGHKPAPDIKLLNRGFHIVYLRVPNLLGSPIAVKHWNTCYKVLTEHYGLASKVALVGLSRGGLYCYNWAIKNPSKVACIYGDAPVCDFKSWPGGKGIGPGDPANWQRVLELWNFPDESAALAYPDNPVDRLQPLADANVPILHVFGDADEVVPWQENTGLIAERYTELGGSIKLIRKPGGKHHPHGLEDPKPIVDFIIRHALNGSAQSKP